jgi:hypothetical protein
MTKVRKRLLQRPDIVNRPEQYDPPQVRQKAHLRLIVNNG